MNRAALTLIACLFALNAAFAQKTLEIIESGGEYLLSHIVKLPANETGSLGLKACATCETHPMPVTPATAYYVDGAKLTLTDFAAVVADLRVGNADQRTLVGLFVDRASHNVTRIYLYKPAQ